MATAQVRRRVERLIALADAVRTHGPLSAVRAWCAAGLERGSARQAQRWMLRLLSLGIVSRRGTRDQTRWHATALGRSRSRALTRIGAVGGLAAVPHGARQDATRRAPRSDGEAMARLMADRALHGQPAMLLVSNGAGDPLASDEEADEW